ncbi:MAG: hypothetical protein OHK0029_25660 [Armatimonadaceae bacterium]
MSAIIAEPTAEFVVEPIRIPYQRFDPARVVGQMSVDEYLNFLQKATHKYHYVNGKVIQMAGASPEHNLIAMNMAVTLRIAFEGAGSDCEVLGSDQRVAVHDRLFYFPDLTIVCGAWQVDNRGALQNPIGIVEILSPSTELDDRTDKFREYQQIDSLRHYILIDQRRVAVTHYSLQDTGIWGIVGDYRDLADSLTIEWNGEAITVPLAQVYRRVSFPAPAGDADATGD